MKKNLIIWGVVIFLLVEFFIAMSPGDIKLEDTKVSPTASLPSIVLNANTTPTNAQSAVAGATTTAAPLSPTIVATKLEVTDITVGTGREVKAGDTVVMNYRGTLTDGTEFDSSYKRNQPFETVIGAGQVIRGWDEGIPGMKVGGKRHLVIPADMAYGTQGVPPTIPPNATLIFDVELLQIK